MNTSSSSQGVSRAVIVGGGLAGMVIANELLKQNIGVLLLEKTERTGGKAGAKLEKGVYEEHGYHVFPTFYANTLALMREIDAFKNLVPITKFHYLIAPGKSPKNNRGVYPHSTIVFHQPDSFGAALKNTFSGIIPWYEYVLFFYAMIDLCSQPFKSRRLLDQVSVAGFIRSRWYRSDIIANFHQQTVLQASSIPSYDLSAMTMKHLVQHWCGKLNPLFRILNGNLQEKFIQPLERQIRNKGCVIRFNTSVTELLTDGDKICGLKLKSADSPPTVERLNPGDVCIIATPLEVTCTFFNDALCQCEDRSDPHPDIDSLGFVNHLEAAPMAAFQFYFNRKIPDLPREHVNLFESKYGLSFIDVSQIWEGLPNTTLSVIASDFRSLKGVSDDEVRGHIFDELRRFIRELKKDDVARVHPEQNIQTPLFLNTVGAWHFRPAARTRIKNLYIAGDYCQTRADLTTMESAVISGRQTAASVLEDAGLDPTSAKPICLARPYWRFKIIKWLFLIPALILRGTIVLVALIKDLVTGNFSLRKWLD
jgi:uncharacterized protein with NAD-binding domain and iron-sulfur cluster